MNDYNRDHSQGSHYPQDINNQASGRRVDEHIQGEHEPGDGRVFYGRFFKYDKPRHVLVGEIGDWFDCATTKYHYEPDRNNFPHEVVMYTSVYYYDKNTHEYIGNLHDKYDFEFKCYWEPNGTKHQRDEKGNFVGENGHYMDAIGIMHTPDGKPYPGPGGVPPPYFPGGGLSPYMFMQPPPNLQPSNLPPPTNHETQQARAGLRPTPSQPDRRPDHPDHSRNSASSHGGRDSQRYDSNQSPNDSQRRPGQGGRESHGARERDSQGYQKNQTPPDSWRDRRQDNSSGGRYNNTDSGKKRYRDANPEVHLSKKFSFILRHGAEKEGFKLMPGGYLYVKEVLEKVESLSDFDQEDVLRMVLYNDKQRFATKVNEENNRLMIRACQGHSIEVEDLEMKPILSRDEIDMCVHGTYFQFWDSIQQSGLSRMTRNHIHFAAGEPGERGVISGMRSSCEIIIYIDFGQALKDGIKFFRSSNNVILSPGNAEGVIAPYYFSMVVRRSPRQMLQFKKTRTDDLAVVSKGKKKNKKNKNKDSHQEGGKENSPMNEHQNKGGKGNKGKQRNKGQKVEKHSDDDTWDKMEGDIPVHPETKPKHDEEETVIAPPTEIPESWEENSEQQAEGATADTEDFGDYFDDDYEIITITDVESGVSAVQYMVEKKSPIAVSCYGINIGSNTGKIKQILCVVPGKGYIFNIEDKSFLVDCQLEDLLSSKDCTKVVYNISITSKTLFDQYRVILDGADVYDVKVAYDIMVQEGWGNMEDLSEIGFEASLFNALAPKVINDKISNDEVEKAKTLTKAYAIMMKLKDKKRIKKDTFDEVNKLIDLSELKMIRNKKKRDKKHK